MKDGRKQVEACAAGNGTSLHKLRSVATIGKSISVFEDVPHRRTNNEVKDYFVEDTAKYMMITPEPCKKESEAKSVHLL